MNSVINSPHLNLRTIVPPIVWGGFGLKMAHDLANDLTTLSALKMSLDRAATEPAPENLQRTAHILGMVIDSISNRLRGMTFLRERFDFSESRLDGERLVRELANHLEPLGWHVEIPPTFPKNLFCHFEVLLLVILALHAHLASPRSLHCSLPSSSTSTRRSMMVLHLGPVSSDTEPWELDHLIGSLQQLLRCMGGLLECQNGEGRPSIRILLAKSC